MATDKSEPRVGLIFSIGLCAVVTLAVMHAALSTYFDFAVQGEELRKFGEIRPSALLSLRAQEKERLTGGPMPIDKAMEEVTREGRKNAKPDFAPVASKDIGPLQGWVKMPAEVPTAMMAVPEANAGAADGGAPQGLAAGSAMDGGSPRLGDAGGSKKKP